MKVEYIKYENRAVPESLYCCAGSIHDVFWFKSKITIGTKYIRNSIGLKRNKNKTNLTSKR